MRLVECDGAARRFGRGRATVVAVHNVTCTVDRGDRIGLLGPSGSGKSTLLHLMGGLITPTSGRITWPSFDDTPHGRTDLVGVVFQGSSLVPLLTVAENVALALSLQGLPEAETRTRTAEALMATGIDGLAQKLPDEISGGQAQRVAVSRVLACSPALILADEPTGRLDRDNARRVLDVLLDSADRLDAALVVATHDPLVADRLTSVWSLHDGTFAGREAVR